MKDEGCISKLESALQELDETAYRLELLVDSGTVKPNLLEPLMKEADELTAMLVSGVKKLNSRKRP